MICLSVCLSVCLYPLNGKMDAVESRLKKQFTTFKVSSEKELKTLLKNGHIFCIVICCNIREKEDIIKVRKICPAKPKIPNIMYGHVSEQELIFQLAKDGLDAFIPNANIELLLEKLHAFKDKATFRIDLKDFDIDLEQCSFWTRKYLKFILKDFNFLRYRFVHEIARIIGISIKHLQRECSKDCSLAPKELLLGLKHFYAAYLLHTTLLPVRIIAEKCGFADDNKFYQSFHDKTGITTTDFRRHNHWQDFPALFMQNIIEKTSKVKA